MCSIGITSATSNPSQSKRAWNLKACRAKTAIKINKFSAFLENSSLEKAIYSTFQDFWKIIFQEQSIASKMATMLKLLQRHWVEKKKRKKKLLSCNENGSSKTIKKRKFAENGRLKEELLSRIGIGARFSWLPFFRMISEVETLFDHLFSEREGKGSGENLSLSSFLSLKKNKSLFSFFLSLPCSPARHTTSHSSFVYFLRIFIYLFFLKKEIIIVIFKGRKNHF